VARILIVGGGCRGRALARASVAAGHAVRVTTRAEQGRAAIEATGAECHIGTPARLATMRAALDGATVLCWLLARATGPAAELAELHTSRLAFFMHQAVDTTVRGVVYETAPDGPVRTGERIAREAASTHAIPLAVIDAPDTPPDGADRPWLDAARAAIEELLRA
jgi:hypothetical protein